MTLHNELQALEAVQARLTKSLRRYLEGTLDETDTNAHSATEGHFVDSRESFVDDSGDVWLTVAGGMGGGFFDAPYRTLEELALLRRSCRALSTSNEFAINGHENRISYIVGWGHTYTAVSKPHADASSDDRQAVQDLIDEFLKINRWHWRQQQNVFRRDRDGEVFLRFFAGDDGMLRVRYVLPEQIFPPMNAKPYQAWGIETLPDDRETVLAYWVNGEPIPAAQIQHRTRGADDECPRGVPIFAPVRKNLARASKILRNMSTVAEIQAAIALIRKHQQATRTAVQAFVAAQATAQQTGPGAGDTRNYRRYEPGTILDAPAGTEYEFPASGIDPGKYVTPLQAELRAVASRLVMAEFMLTSDASNANFASTMVAEGPPVKMFERLQWDEIEQDRLIFDLMLRTAVNAGRLDAEVLDRVTIDIQPPGVRVRDTLREAQTAQILDTLGWLSPQTGSAQFGLEYEQEQANIEQHRERSG